MVKITCSSCHKPLSLDETKLPMKEVAFPCPSCKTRLTIDRRTLEPAAAAEIPAREDELGEKALLVGAPDTEVADAVKALGFQPLHFGSVESARDFYLREYPKLVVLRPMQLTPPPIGDMLPITSLNPVDRRKGFFIMVADGLRTFDGNAAFLYGVNLVVSSKDLGSFSQIYHDAEAHHQRMYAAMTAALH